MNEKVAKKTRRETRKEIRRLWECELRNYRSLPFRKRLRIALYILRGREPRREALA